MAYVNPTFVNNSEPALDASNLNELANAVQNLEVENGGTGRTSLTAGAILVGNGTDNVTLLNTSGAVYIDSDGVAHSGVVSVANGGTGAVNAAAARVNLGLEKAGFVVQATVPDDTNKLWINSTNGVMSYYYNGAWCKVSGTFAPNT